MENETTLALEILINKCNESVKSGKLLLSEEELHLVYVLSAWYEGYLVGKLNEHNI